MFPFALLFGAIGAVAQIAGAFTQASASSQIAKESSHTEDLRRQQMLLEGERQKRESIRNTLKARSLGLVAGVASGANLGSSGIQGGQAQISNHGAENVSGVSKGTSIGGQIFDSNAKIAGLGSLAAWGGGLSSLGQTVSGLKVG